MGWESAAGAVALQVEIDNACLYGRDCTGAGLRLLSSPGIGMRSYSRATFSAASPAVLSEAESEDLDPDSLDKW